MPKIECVAMLLAGGEGKRLSHLTRRLAKPAVPFGGKYRIIDFTLSNCCNSGIYTVGVLTQYQPMVLNTYIGIGSSWDLDRKNGGVTLLPPFVEQNGGRWYKGTSHAIYQNISYLEQYDTEYVLIISGDHIYKMNYDLMLQRHKEIKADVTIAVIEIPIEESYRFGMMKVDQDDWITEFQEKPKVTTSNTASMGVYIFNWKLLKQYLMADEEKPHTNSDFGQDIIPAMLADNQRLYAYRYKGYWKDVGTIDSLWEAHMDLLADDKPFRLHDPKWRIFTKNPNQPPQYIGASARINRSLVNEGCNVLGIINVSINQPLLHELTYSRTTATVPFGGRYRLIDFVLSNMVNSGISNVAVLAHNNFRSIMDHVGSGKEWDLDRKQRGLFILPPANTNSPSFNGDLQNFYGHLEYFSRSSEEYVIVSSSHMICNIDFTEVVAAHIAKNADITIIYKELDSVKEDLSNLIIVDLDEDNRVVGMAENHLKNESNKVYMRMIVIKKDLLVDFVKKSVMQNYYDLVRHVIIRNLHTLNVYAYEYKGYLAIVNSVHNYYKYSMDLLKPQVWKALFFKPGLIYTKVKDEPPVEYTERASVTNSLVANGCIIEGSVENSILFRGVKVGKGAVVKNSIVMQKCVIESDATLDYVILDKDVHVANGHSLVGVSNSPTVITKSSSV